RLILTQKEDLGFIMNPWSFFFIGYVFSQPLSYIRKHCVTLKHESYDSYRAKNQSGRCALGAVVDGC
ncbi:hypothetical protein, partial [Laedolimicola ammoniilytica]